MVQKQKIPNGMLNLNFVGSSMYSLPPADPFQRTDGLHIGAATSEQDVKVEDKSGLV